jgi:thioredoxin reductase (NADPH)
MEREAAMLPAPLVERSSCHALMVATGVQWRKLDIPGMERLQGAGVHYGAGPAEAISCRDEEVYIVGGANSAGQAAMNFSRSGATRSDNR